MGLLDPEDDVVALPLAFAVSFDAAGERSAAGSESKGTTYLRRETTTGASYRSYLSKYCQKLPLGVEIRQFDNNLKREDKTHVHSLYVQRQNCHLRICGLLLLSLAIPSANSQSRLL